MVRLVEYSDSSDEDEEKIESGRDSGNDSEQEQEEWWRHHVGRKKNDDMSEQDSTTSSSFDDVSTNKARPGSAKRVKSPSSPKSTTSSLPSYASSSSSSSSAANSPWSTPGQSDSSASSSTMQDGHLQAAKAPFATAESNAGFGSSFRSPTKPSSVFAGSFGNSGAATATATARVENGGTNSAGTFVFGQFGTTVWPNTFQFGQKAAQPETPQEKKPKSDPEPVSEAFKTSFAQDAFKKMKNRLFFGGGGATSASESEADAVSEGATATTSVFGSVSAPSTHTNNRPAFRPYDKGNATPTSARGSSARRRPHRDIRRSQPESGAQATGFRGLFANAGQSQGPSQQSHTAFGSSSATAPGVSFMNGATTTVFTSSAQRSRFDHESSAKHLDGGDTRMDSPTSSSNDKKKTAAVFTFSKQQKKRITPFPAFHNRPSATQADKRAPTGDPVFGTVGKQHRQSGGDTVMKETSAVEFTNIFKRQNSNSSAAFPASVSRSESKFGDPVPAEASKAPPAFQFGSAVPSRGGWSSFTTSSASTAPPTWPFGGKNKANAGSTGSSFVFKQPEPSSSKGVVSNLRRRRRLNTATSAANGSSAASQSPADATNLFSFHHQRVPRSRQESSIPSHIANHTPAGATSAPAVFGVGNQGGTFPVMTPTTFVFGAPPKPDPVASSAAKTGTNVFTRDQGAAPAAFTNPNVGAGAQFPFGMATPTAPFVFGRPKLREQQAQTSDPTFGDSEPRVGDFTFEPRAAEFTPTHRSSRKADSHRKLRASFRAKATLGTTTTTGSATPAPDTTSATPGLSMESPFGLNTNASVRTNIFQQKRANSEYSAPADPFATPVFQRTTASEPSGVFPASQSKNGSASAKQKLDFSFLAGSRADANGSVTPGQGASVKEVYTFGASSAASQQDKPKKHPGFVFSSSDRASNGQTDARKVFRNGKATTKVHLRKQSSTSVNTAAAAATSPSSSSNGPAGAQSGQSENVNTDTPSKFPPRRILRVVRPSKKAQGSSPISGEDTDEFGDGDTTMGGDDRKRNDGTDWGELKRLGGLAYSRRSFREAAELYRRSVEAIELLLRNYPDLETEELMKDKAKLHSNRAASLMMLMQFPDALWECQQSIEVDPSYTRAYIRLCRIQVLYGDIVQAQQNIGIAKQQLSQVFFLNVDPADKASIEKTEQSIEKLSHFQVDIKWLMDIHEWAKALKSIDEALALAPYSRSLQVLKTQVLFKRKNYIAVVRFCNEVVEKHNKINKAALSPKHTASSPGKSKAEQDVTIVGVDMGLHWASALHYQNRADEAMVLVNALEHVAPCSSSVIQLKRKLIVMKDLKHNANDAFKCNDFDRAVRIYSQALEIDPQDDEYNAVIYCNRAAAYMGMEQFNTAHLDCEEALRRKQQYPRALLRRARCFVALKKYQQALRDFDQYVKEQHRDSSPSATTGPPLADIELERAHVKTTMDMEREEKKKQAEARKRANARQRHRYAWEDSDFYEDFRSSYFKSTGSQSSGRSHAGYGGGGAWHNQPPAVQPKVKERTFYQVLGVHQRATADEVKKAYRKLALLHHPDKAKSDKDADLFKDMSAAYTVLSDPVARKKYDMELLYR